MQRANEPTRKRRRTQTRRRAHPPGLCLYAPCHHDSNHRHKLQLIVQLDCEHAYCRELFSTHVHRWEPSVAHGVEMLQDLSLHLDWSQIRTQLPF